MHFPFFFFNYSIAARWRAVAPIEGVVWKGIGATTM